MSKTCWDDHLNDFASPDSVNFMIFADNESAEPYSGADILKKLVNIISI